MVDEHTETPQADKKVHDLDTTTRPPSCTCGRAQYAGSPTFVRDRHAAHVHDQQRGRLSINVNDEMADLLRTTRDAERPATEVVRRAVSLYKFLTDEQAAGSRAYMVASNGTRTEVVFT